MGILQNLKGLVTKVQNELGLQIIYERQLELTARYPIFLMMSGNLPVNIGLPVFYLFQDEHLVV